jgi:thioredoxin-like negative regulator of GroEL
MASAAQPQQASEAVRGSTGAEAAAPAQVKRPATPGSERPSLVFFYSQTSGKSRRAEGFLAQVLQRRSNHATFRLVRVDAERRPDLVERFKVDELPTLLVIAEGRVRGRVVKPSGCQQITHLLSPWLK